LASVWGKKNGGAKEGDQEEKGAAKGRTEEGPRGCRSSGKEAIKSKPGGGSLPPRGESRAWKEQTEHNRRQGGRKRKILREKDKRAPPKKVGKKNRERELMSKGNDIVRVRGPKSADSRQRKDSSIAKTKKIPDPKGKEKTARQETNIQQGESDQQAKRK